VLASSKIATELPSLISGYSPWAQTEGKSPSTIAEDIIDINPFPIPEGKGGLAIAPALLSNALVGLMASNGQYYWQKSTIRV